METNMDQELTWDDVLGVTPSTPETNDGGLSWEGVLGDTGSPKKPGKPKVQEDMGWFDPEATPHTDEQFIRGVDVDQMKMYQQAAQLSPRLRRLITDDSISAMVKGEQIKEELDIDIVNSLRHRGIDARIHLGKIQVKQDNADVYHDLKEDDIVGLMAHGGQYSGALVGAWAGMNWGMAATGPVPNPWAKAGGAFGGALGGAIVGGTAGLAIDNMIAAHQLGEEIDADLFKQRVINSAIDEAVGGFVFPIVNVLGKGAKHALTRGLNIALMGNSQGVSIFLREAGVDKDKAKEAAKHMVEFANKVKSSEFSRLSKRDQELYSLFFGGEGGAGSIVIKNLGQKGGTRGFIAAQDDIAKRANVVKEQLRGLKGDGHINDEFMKAYNGYVSDVKKFYSDSMEVAKEIPLVDKQNLAQLANEDLLEYMSTFVNDPTVGLRIAGLNEKLWKLAAGKDQTVHDLVSLQTHLNELMGSKGVLGHGGLYETLRGTKEKIDDVISFQLHKLGGDAPLWHDMHKVANSLYSEMGTIRDTSLGKTLKGELTPKGLVKALEKASVVTHSGGKPFRAYDNLIDRLPADMKVKVEGAIVDNLVEKSIIRDGAGLEIGLDYHKLLLGLEEQNFRSPEVLKHIEAVKELSQVFRNDTVISRMWADFTGGSTGTKLSADLGYRGQIIAVNWFMDTIGHLLPTSSGAALKTSRSLSKALKNVRNTMNVEELYKNMLKDPRLQNKVPSYKKSMQDLMDIYGEASDVAKRRYGDFDTSRVNLNLPMKGGEQ